MTQAERIKRLERVAILAGALILEAPNPKRRGFGFQSYVSHRSLDELAAALAAAGFDLAAARKRLKKGSWTRRGRAPMPASPPKGVPMQSERYGEYVISHRPDDWWRVSDRAGNDISIHDSRAEAVAALKRYQAADARRKGGTQ